MFFGESRLKAHDSAHSGHDIVPHESPSVMTMPLVMLAACSVLLGFIGTPAWHVFHAFLGGERIGVDFGRFGESGIVAVMLISTSMVFLGLGLGWWLYGRKPIVSADAPDVLATIQPQMFRILQNKYYVDELYEATIIRWNALAANLSAWLDRNIWAGGVKGVSLAVVGLAWFNRTVDAKVVNAGFDAGCEGANQGARFLSHLQTGRVQTYLKVIGVALVVFVLFLVWGSKG